MPRTKKCGHKWQDIGPQPSDGQNYTKVNWCRQCGCIKLEKMEFKYVGMNHEKVEVTYSKPKSYKGSII